MPNAKMNMKEEKYQRLEEKDWNCIFNLGKNIKWISLEWN